MTAKEFKVVIVGDGAIGNTARRLLLACIRASVPVCECATVRCASVSDVRVTQARRAS